MMHAYAPRMSLAGSPNFRDLGGHRTEDGRRMRTGLVFRSQALSLTPHDAAVVDALGIGLDIDLRRAEEIEAAPDVIPSGARYVHLDVNADMPYALLRAIGVDSVADARAAMKAGEIFMATDENARRNFGALIGLVATCDRPVLYHCTAGKDRTGWSSAVLLSLLDVPRPAIIDDYLLSNDRYFDSPEVQADLRSLPPCERAIHASMVHLQAAYLEAGLDEVRRRHGSMHRYATTSIADGGLGLRPALITQLRNRLLTTSPSW